MIKEIAENNSAGVVNCNSSIPVWFLNSNLVNVIGTSTTLRLRSVSSPVSSSVTSHTCRKELFLLSHHGKVDWNEDYCENQSVAEDAHDVEQTIDRNDKNCNIQDRSSDVLSSFVIKEDEQEG